MFKSSILSVTLAAAALTACFPLAATTAFAADDSAVAAPASSCATPNVGAGTIAAAPADRPWLATTYDLGGTAYVQVDLDPQGAIQRATISKSSGEYVLDRAAVAAAEQSTFRPEIRNCVPVAGSYIFIVDFPQQ